MNLIFTRKIYTYIYTTFELPTRNIYGKDFVTQICYLEDVGFGTNNSCTTHMLER